MTNPDVRPYVDLTLYDRSAQAIFEQALLDAQTKLPGWVPREGNTEVVILEEQALEVSETVFAANRVPGAVTEVLLRLFGLEPDLGAPATAEVRFDLADTFGHEIPIGTALRLSVAGAEPVEFVTSAGLAVPPGSSQGTVAVVATENGQRAHFAVVGTTLTLLDAVTFVDTVTLTQAPANGREPEAIETFLDRGIQRLSRLVTTLTLPNHFTLAALEDPAVERATTIDNFNSDAGAGAPGDHSGHVTVAVAGAGGGSLSAADKTNLETVLEAAALANLDVHVADPTMTTINVTVTVVRLAGYADADVTADVTAALTEYLNPDTWPWAGTVWTNELISLIDRVDGVDRVVDVTLTGGTAVTGGRSLPGVAPLADLGSVTVTVQAPS